MHEGHPDAKICLITDQPSRKDELRGRLFSGDGGQQLGYFLQTAGLSRGEVSIYTLSDEILREPNRNKAVKGMHPTPEIKKRAEEILRKTGANTYVACGELATVILTGFQDLPKKGAKINSPTVAKYRGSPLGCAILGHARKEIIPTWHPDDLFDNSFYSSSTTYLRRYASIADFKKIVRHSKKPGVLTPDPHLILDPDFNTVMDFLARIRSERKLTAFDIEVYNNQVSCLSFANSSDVAICIPFLGKWNETEEIAIWVRIAQILSDPLVPLLIQNFMFDLSFMYMQNHILIQGPVDCSMTAFRIMWPDLPSGLDYLVSLYTDHPYYKDDKKLWSQPYKDPMQFFRYNARDAVCLLDVWNGGPLPGSPALKADLEEDKEFLAMYREDMKQRDPALYMMTRGIRANLENLAIARAEAQEQLNKIKERLDKISVVPFNPASPKQVAQYLYEIKKVKPYTHHKTKKMTTDDLTLTRIARRDNLEEARLIQEFRRLSKLINTYLDMKLDSDGRMRCFFNIRGTSTGRYSSGKTVKGTGMNMQNLDPIFKRVLEADK